MYRWLEMGWIRAFAGMTLALSFVPPALAVTPSQAAGPFPGIGRTATPAEIAAWDIDVRPDFKGLPAGSGSVAKGQEVWDGKCASCHGTFGESNEVFAPIVGGTTAQDVKSGRVKALARNDIGRTTLMKLSTVSTLWDYINRAMPWTAPKSLTTEEVYAVVAYILHLGDVVPADFVLSDRNIAQVQQRLPNRDGMSRRHGLWELRGKADVANTACMSNCAAEVRIASAMPDHARDSHGDLAEQNRPVGPVRGVRLAAVPRSLGNVVAANAATGASASDAAPMASGAVPSAAQLASNQACLGCHAAEQRLVGPSLREVAERYHGQRGAEARLVEKVRRGGSGVWGAMAMPAHPGLSEGDARELVRWILAGAR